jgi:hypothetical protein
VPGVKLYAVDAENELGAGDELGNLAADAVRLNTGTTMAKHKLKPGVEEYSFMQSMDPAALRRFLSDRDLLGPDGMLKETARLIVGGFGLSLIDQLIALHEFMGLFEAVEGSHGGDWRINPAALEKYEGALVVVSNTGASVPPRLTGKSPQWTQRDEPLGTARELHAAYLHENGEKVFTDWEDIIKASVARTLDTTPQKLQYAGMGVDQRLAAQLQSTLKYEAALVAASRRPSGPAKTVAYEEAARQEESAFRQAYFGSTIGIGMARDAGKVVDELAKAAPYTSKERLGTYLTLNAQLAGLTQKKEGSLPENKPLVAMYDKRMSYVTASPSKVWPLLPRLFGFEDHGTPGHPEVVKGPAICRAVLGSYGNITHVKRGADKPLQLIADGSTFDAFIVSPTFDRGAEPAVAGLAGHIEPVHPSLPTIGTVTHNRRLRAPGGAATHVEDYSLNGKGAFVPGTASKIGGFGYDVNNRESATALAPGLAYRRFAAEHLKAAGIEDAYDQVEMLYREHLPTDEVYAAEVEQFRRDFFSMQQKAMLARNASTAAHGNAVEFAQIVDAGRPGDLTESHRALLQGVLGPAGMRAGMTAAEFRRNFAAAEDPALEKARRYADASISFGEEVEKAVAFNPASRERFYARFANVPDYIHKAVYEQALQIALKHLAERKATTQVNGHAPNGDH